MKLHFFGAALLALAVAAPASAQIAPGQFPNKPPPTPGVFCPPKSEYKCINGKPALCSNKIVKTKTGGSVCRFGCTGNVTGGINPCRS